MRKGSGLGEIEDVHLRTHAGTHARTTRIRQHADNDHHKQYPKPRRQTNLRRLVYCFRCLCLRDCAIWVTDPRAQPLDSDMIAILRW